ncbi:NAD(P)-dependent alcohol dehydrogenase [Pseudooceanicola sp. 200-1SW]|uniref:NAD(P)-dependent alcohol dehydrogenase n=1 Tax=Pseudooceanicola sp. 200-1SW TaxID=3425949 RepID=UPI003D7F5B02
MKAIVYAKYGGPEVLHLAERRAPALPEGGARVRVQAAAVTSADWRLRAAAFPGVLALVGRAMFGLLRPRAEVLGSAFAGEVTEAAPGAPWRPGQQALGFVPAGAHAEELVIGPGACVVARPEGMSAEAGAALPFGGLAALVFLRDVAKVQPGQRVLITGGSGEVGAMAVQIARALGARVTAMASAGNLDLLRDLGAETVWDYRATDLARIEGGAEGGFDLVFDTFGALSVRQARALLRPGGVFVPLNFGLAEIAAALCPWALKPVRIHVNADRAEDLTTLLALWQAGQLRPQIDARYPLAEARSAHARVEGRHKRGAVLLQMTRREEA